MKNLIFLAKALLHFVYVFITGLLGMKHRYFLSFTKDENERWYIDLPDWPFQHANLEMVSGADELCEYLGDGNKCEVTVITSNSKVDNTDEYIRCDRDWAHLKWGGEYTIPDPEIPLTRIWLCQVTLFVIGWWPKYIYVKKTQHV